MAAWSRKTWKFCEQFLRVFFGKTTPTIGCLSNCRYYADRAQNMPGPGPAHNNVLTLLQISSKSVHFRRSYRRMREHRFWPGRVFLSFARSYASLRANKNKVARVQYQKTWRENRTKCKVHPITATKITTKTQIRELRSVISEFILHQILWQDARECCRTVLSRRYPSPSVTGRDQCS